MEKIQYPEYEVSNKNAELEAERKAAENRMREQEEKARRDRDMAIFGDVANLFAQGAALHVGGKNVEKTPSAAAVGNERLRKLQEGNSKQMAEYARQQIEARDAARKERNAQKQAQYNAEVEQYKRDLEAQKYAKEQDRKDKQDALKEAETASVIEKNKAYANYYNNGGRGTAGGGSSVNRDVYLVNDDGTKKVFKHSENANNIQAAYAELPSEFKAQKEVKLYDEDDVGRPVLRIDAEGMPVTRLVENTKPTLGEMRQAIEEYNARELKKDVTREPGKNGDNTPPSRRKDNSNTPPSRR